MKKILIFLFAMMLVVGMSGTASALTLSSVDVTWTGTTGGANINYNDSVIVGYGNGLEDHIRWGIGTSGQSGLGFTGSAPPDLTFNIGDAFEIG